MRSYNQSIFAHTHSYIQLEPSSFQRTYQPTTAIMSTNNKDQTSTLSSYVDQATGAVQSALGSLTGSTTDKVRVSSLRILCLGAI